MISFVFIFKLLIQLVTYFLEDIQSDHQFNSFGISLKRKGYCCLSILTKRRFERPLLINKLNCDANAAPYRTEPFCTGPFIDNSPFSKNLRLGLGVTLIIPKEVKR